MDKKIIIGIIVAVIIIMVYMQQLNFSKWSNIINRPAGATDEIIIYDTISLPDRHGGRDVIA